MKGLTPTQRTLQLLREQGIPAQSVERWNPYVGPHGIRQDLFGWIDIIGMIRGQGILAIQTCTGSGFSARLKKILDSECTERVEDWLASKGLAQIWAWRKVKKQRGGKQMVWEPKIHVITLEQLHRGVQVDWDQFKDETDDD